MRERLPSGAILPEALYIGGFAKAAEAAVLAMDTFDIHKPATLYYPGSGGDASFVSLIDVSVIHADPNLSDEAIKGFQSLGAEAHRENAMSWQPPKDVDIVAFINASGFSLPTVLDHSRLRRGGLVLNGAGWGGSRVLHEREDLKLMGVIDDESIKLKIDRERLDEYFKPKMYEELDDAEREYFSRRLADIASQHELELDMIDAEAYELLKLEDNADLAQSVQYTFPPKPGGLFVFQKQ